MITLLIASINSFVVNATLFFYSKYQLLLFRNCLQFVLPVTWSYGRKYGVTLEQLTSWWSEKPAKLAGLDLKVMFSVFLCYYIHQGPKKKLYPAWSMLFHSTLLQKLK